MIVGGYTLHLYCDHPKHPTMEEAARMGQAAWALYGSLNPADYAGRNERVCLAKGRKAGWRYRKAANGLREAICPKCRELHGDRVHVAGVVRR